jgi:hypothetical protein
MTEKNPLDPIGFMRLRHIVGGQGSPGVLPVSRSTWWAGVADGRFPQPVRLGRCTMWRTSDIQALLERISEGA